MLDGQYRRRYLVWADGVENSKPGRPPAFADGGGGMTPESGIKVRNADGRQAKHASAEGVCFQLLGRHGTLTAVVEPKSTTALVGAIVLENLDLLVDCAAQKVVPRDPNGETFEIE